MWISIAAAIWIVWLVLRVVQLRRVHQQRRDDTIAVPQAEAMPASMPSVDIIVPARNEADEVQASLERALAQDYPNFRVMLVNDRSEDQTAVIARGVAVTDERLSVVEIDALPDGWLGKANAMWSAAGTSTADWLLFIDVDLSLEENALRATMLECERRGVEILSLWPRVRDEGFLIPITIPFYGALVGMWFQSRHVNDPSRSDAGVINGQFMLIRREAYERLGGHRAVRDCLIEDVPFGRHAKKSGASLFCGIGGAFATVRMYRKPGAMIEGWTRIFAGALKRWQVAVTFLAILTGFAPYIVLPILLVRGEADALGVGFGVLSVLHLLLTTLINWQLWDITGCSKRWLWFYPIALVVGAVTFARAWLRLTTGHTFTWRDTGYDIDRNGRIVSRT